MHHAGITCSICSCIAVTCMIASSFAGLCILYGGQGNQYPNGPRRALSAAQNQERAEYEAGVRDERLGITPGTVD